MKVKNARVCVDCDNVFGKHHAVCPQCGSSSWFFLSRFVPSLQEESGQEICGTYHPDHGTGPEQDPNEDLPRPFFARCWARLMAPFRPEDLEVSA